MLIYDTCFSLSDLLNSVRHSLGPSVHCFLRHNAIAHLIDYGRVETKLLYALQNQKICVTRFIGIFALLQCSGTKPATAPSCDYT